MTETAYNRAIAVRFWSDSPFPFICVRTLWIPPYSINMFLFTHNLTYLPLSFFAIILGI